MQADAACPKERQRENAAEPQRYDYLDNIKWVLAVLVIFHHAAAIAGLDPFPFNLPRVIQSEQYQYETPGFFHGPVLFYLSLFCRAVLQQKRKKIFFARQVETLGHSRTMDRVHH